MCVCGGGESRKKIPRDWYNVNIKHLIHTYVRIYTYRHGRLDNNTVGEDKRCIIIIIVIIFDGDSAIRGDTTV